MIEREYEYRLKAGRARTRSILYGAGALFFAYMALTNDRGLNLYCIPLTESRATIFYAVFGGLAALFSAYDAANVAYRGSLRQRIAFAKEGLMVPRSMWSSEEQLIPYASIRNMREFTEPDTLVIIRHEEGEFTLRFDMLPDERAYAEIGQNLTSLVQAAKAGDGSKSIQGPEPA